MADQVGLKSESSLEALGQIERAVAELGPEHEWPRTRYSMCSWRWTN